MENINKTEPYDSNKKAFLCFERRGNKIRIPKEVLKVLMKLNEERGEKKMGIVYMTQDIQEMLKVSNTYHSEDWMTIEQLREKLSEAYQRGRRGNPFSDNDQF